MVSTVESMLRMDSRLLWICVPCSSNQKTEQGITVIGPLTDWVESGFKPGISPGIEAAASGCEQG